MVPDMTTESWNWGHTGKGPSLAECPPETSTGLRTLCTFSHSTFGMQEGEAFSDCVSDNCRDCVWPVTPPKSPMAARTWGDPGPLKQCGHQVPLAPLVVRRLPVVSSARPRGCPAGGLLGHGELGHEGRPRGCCQGSPVAYRDGACWWWGLLSCRESCVSLALCLW